ncbi:hypothetical protein D3C84_1041200 [compost metagenome]
MDASSVSSFNRPSPAGPMAAPSTRHTADVVTGIQRRYEEVSASVSNTAPNTATHKMKLMLGTRRCTADRRRMADSG